MKELFLKYDVLTISSVGFSAIIAIIGAAYAFSEYRKDSNSVKSGTGFVLAMLSLYIGLLTATLSGELQNVRCDLKEMTGKNSSAVLVASTPLDRREILKAMQDKLAENKNTAISLSWCYSSPGLLPGTSPKDDRVIGNDFAAAPFKGNAAFCFAFPWRDSLQYREERSQRRQMLKFFFSFLTRKSLTEMSAPVRQHLRFYHVPRDMQRDVWCLKCAASQWAGISYLDGKWKDTVQQPDVKIMLHTEMPAVVNGINSELDQLSDEAIEHLRTEFAKTEEYRRCPCTLFVDRQEELERGLQVLPVDRVKEKLARRLASCRNSADGGIAQTALIEEALEIIGNVSQDEE